MTIAKLFDHDIGDILAVLPEFEPIWLEEGWRANIPYSPHKDSQVISLRRQPGSRPRDVLHQLASVATRHYCCGPLAGAIEAICEYVQGRPARAMLVRLPPGGIVTPHIDTGIYAEATTRFHLPLVTNPGAWMIVDGVRYHLPAGAVFCFDKHVEHSAANDGDEPRTHLIVDCHPESPAVSAG
jgi:quercetin dioxygenase-like cupin family protein